jgi:hypothetical protein
MSTHEQVIRRFAAEAGKPGAKFLKGDDFVFPEHRNYWSNGDTVYSYGHHFPLAVIMPSADGNPRGWWLLNGDLYMLHGSRGMMTSPSTRRHQDMTREAVKKTGLPYITLSFRALREAGIDTATIVPVEVLPDRYTWERYVREDAPKDWELRKTVEDGSVPNSSYYFRNWQLREDGRWSYERPLHHLGESVFTAGYQYETRTPGYYDFETHTAVPSSYERTRGSAYFLSAFDRNEPGNGLYFMAQLPDGAHPATVEEALETLKPNLVKGAEDIGRAVLRQGDVFAIPHPEVQTRQLKPAPDNYVLGVNHTVTERRTLHGREFGRGIMRHRPQDGRAPEHRNLKLGGGKTWYELFRNTVPEGRSWSLGGDVD